MVNLRESIYPFKHFIYVSPPLHYLSVAHEKPDAIGHYADSRARGGIANELDGNGGINWDNDYKQMADTFLVFVKQGKPLPFTELAEAEEIVKQIKQKRGDCDRLCELGVKWVVGNPSPLGLSLVDYER